MKNNQKNKTPLRLLMAAALVVANGPAGRGSQSVAGTPILYGPYQTCVNVMKDARPALPTFPALTPKKGIVRGYVKDSNGKPLVGAKLGVRSSGVGGFYSGASATTDARGYYEIRVPWGAAHFYSAGYTIDYGAGRAALGLHPADGEADSFPSVSGHIENWVLLPYGIADPDGASEKPASSLNYYGGSLFIDYSIADPRPLFANDDSLPEGAEIELTLTSEGPLLGGGAGRSFVIRKRVAEQSYNTIILNNLPIGRYVIEGRLREGTKTSPLRLEETGPNGHSPFGLEPKAVRGKATLTFRPDGARAALALPQHGNWASLAIALKR